jgi:hypothetical protein
MKLTRPTVIAALATGAVYLGVAWVARAVPVPADVPTARVPWWGPFRVIATVGFEVATLTGLPHLAGDLVAAVLLGGLLGAVFTVCRLALR